MVGTLVKELFFCGFPYIYVKIAVYHDMKHTCQVKHSLIFVTSNDFKYTWFMLFLIWLFLYFICVFVSVCNQWFSHIKRGKLTLWLFYIRASGSINIFLLTGQQFIVNSRTFCSPSLHRKLCPNSKRSNIWQCNCLTSG